MKKISNWDVQRKIFLNLDASNKLKKLLLVGNEKQGTHLPLVFNNTIVPQTNSKQKLLEVTLDLEFAF